MQMDEEPEADRRMASQQPTVADVEAFQRLCDRTGPPTPPAQSRAGAAPRRHPPVT
jgi:hypothetical protein